MPIEEDKEYTFSFVYPKWVLEEGASFRTVRYELVDVKCLGTHESIREAIKRKFKEFEDFTVQRNHPLSGLTVKFKHDGALIPVCVALGDGTSKLVLVYNEMLYYVQLDD